MKVSENQRSWALLVLIFVAWGFGYVDKQAINIATVAIRQDLGLSASEMGIVMSSFFFSYSAMTLAGGFLAAKFGTKRSLVGIVFLWAVFSCLTGMAGSLAMLVMIRFFFGLSQGGFGAITSITVTELFPPEMRGRAKTFQVSAGSMGIAVGAILAAALTVAVGWRMMFICFGVIGVIIVFLLYRFYRVRQGLMAEGEETQAVASIKAVSKIRLVWKLAAIQFALGTFIWGLNAWMPSYWMDVKKLDMMTMGTLSMIPWIISFACMNVNSWFMDRYVQKKEKFILGGTLALSGLFMYVMLQMESIVMTFSCLTVVTILASVASAVVYTIPMKYMPRETVGAATGIIIFGQQLSGVVAPAVMGYMITVFAGSYHAVFGFVIAVLCIASAIAFSIRVKKEDIGRYMSCQ